MTVAIYIAGPMSGLPDSNYPAFLAAEEQLRAAGHTRIVNPARSVLPANATWQEFMRDGLTGLLRCNGVALLPGWQRSRGARIERNLAIGLGLDIRHLSGWLT